MKGTPQKILGREDIPHTGSNKKIQSIAFMIIVVFYRDNEDKQQSCHQLYQT